MGYEHIRGDERRLLTRAQQMGNRVLESSIRLDYAIEQFSPFNRSGWPRHMTEAQLTDSESLLEESTRQAFDTVDATRNDEDLDWVDWLRLLSKAHNADVHANIDGAFISTKGHEIRKELLNGLSGSYTEILRIALIVDHATRRTYDETADERAQEILQERIRRISGAIGEYAILGLMNYNSSVQSATIESSVLDDHFRSTDLWHYHSTHKPFRAYKTPFQIKYSQKAVDETVAKGSTLVPDQGHLLVYRDYDPSSDYKLARSLVKLMEPQSLTSHEADIFESARKKLNQDLAAKLGAQPGYILPGRDFSDTLIYRKIAS